MRRLGLLAVLTLMLVVALWRWQPASEGPAATAGDSDTLPGYVATQAELVDTGDDGQPRFRLRATRISQRHPGAMVELEEPRLDYQGSTHWQVQARSGTLPQDASSVNLSGAVQATAERGREPALRIRTETLDIDLANRRADTGAAVLVDLGANRLAAVGLHADMKADSLRLESAVHGEYAR
jgi:LPS export ABC transporter protein LptC